MNRIRKERRLGQQTLTETISRVTPTLPLRVQRALRTPLKRRVAITHVLEEMHLGLVRQQRRCDGVHGCVAPSLIVEPACFVEIVEEIGVRLGPPEIHVGDFEVGPDWRW